MEAYVNTLFYEAEHYFFEAINSRSCAFDSHCTAYSTEIYDPALNIFFIRKHVPSLEEMDPEPISSVMLTI